MISGGDLAVFVAVLIIVISFFVILRRLLEGGEGESDSHGDGHSKR